MLIHASQLLNLPLFLLLLRWGPFLSLSPTLSLGDLTGLAQKPKTLFLTTATTPLLHSLPIHLQHYLRGQSVTSPNPRLSLL
jgi:hypothetical protein